MLYSGGGTSPLTDEETLLATRNGFVTIWISPCHDLSSTPVIDSVEVYARPRSDLPYLLSDQQENENSLVESVRPSCATATKSDTFISEMLIES